MTAPDANRRHDPSDREVLAAANAYMHYKPPYNDLSDFSAQFLDDIRSALRAARLEEARS